MGTSSGYFVLTVLCCILPVLFATQNDHEPMVAFVCKKPAMHRGVNGWISDKDTKECWDNKRDILNYCKKMYPNHNITNVVESSYLVTIPGWPSLNGDAMHDHRVRPFRCIVDSFQSDALLVPQHCKFDHDHNDQVCEGFSHWEVVARDACAKDGMHCESFGMLLNCGLGTFSGVEYVCCPNKTPTRMHPVPTSTPAPHTDDDDNDSGWESKGSSVDLDLEHAGSKVNLYELYLKGEPMPASLENEHQKFEAARQYMHRLQEAKNTQLMKEWTAARDHVTEVRKNDPKTASKLNEEITQRFQRLYSAYEEEDIAEKQQLVALHQQRVQADLNQRKRMAMDKYMRSLESGDVERIAKNLRQYIRAEEKDVLHTVNHYGHVKATNGQEATRTHPHIIQHLQLCQQRMEQALEMLKRYPDIERQVRPGIEEFMKQYDSMATRIRNVVLPDPSPSNVHSDSEDDDNNSNHQANVAAVQPQKIDDLHEDDNDDDKVGKDDHSSSNENDSAAPADDDDVREDEHDYERNMFRPAHQQHSAMHVQQNMAESTTSTSAKVGTTLGIAVGSVAIFVVLVVAVVMVRRRSSGGAGSVTHGYVEVDPAASPEERHVANMQMNGYENPTYRYFEVQTTK